MDILGLGVLLKTTFFQFLILTESLSSPVFHDYESRIDMKFFHFKAQVFESMKTLHDWTEKLDVRLLNVHFSAPRRYLILAA